MTGGEILSALFEMIGRDLTLRLLSLRGGQEVYIPSPSNLTPDHWLSMAVGFEAAMKVADQYQGDKITLPLGPEGGCRNALHRVVQDSAAAGASVNQIVQETGLHARTVRRIKNRRPTGRALGGRVVDPRQMQLFDDLYMAHDKD